MRSAPARQLASLDTSSAGRLERTDDSSRPAETRPEPESPRGTLAILGEEWRGALAGSAILAFDVAMRAAGLLGAGRLPLSDAFARQHAAVLAWLVPGITLAGGVLIAFGAGIALGWRNARSTAMARALTAVFVYATLDIVLRPLVTAHADASLVSFAWYVPKLLAATAGAALVARSRAAPSALAHVEIEPHATTLATTPHSEVAPVSGRRAKERPSGRTMLMPVSAITGTQETHAPPSGETRVMPLSVQIARERTADLGEMSPEAATNDGAA